MCSLDHTGIGGAIRHILSDPPARDPKQLTSSSGHLAEITSLITSLTSHGWDHFGAQPERSKVRDQCERGSLGVALWTVSGRFLGSLYDLIGSLRVPGR